MSELKVDEARLKLEAERGFWPGAVLTDYLDVFVRDRPDAAAVLEHRAEFGSETSLSFKELNSRASQIARGLHRLGIGRGDFVSFQLPNCWQFVAIHLACLKVGAVSNPLMPIFRQRELSFMLGHADAKVFIAPQSFRGFDHASLARRLGEEISTIEHVFIVGGFGDDAFDAAFPADEAGKAFETGSALGPDDVIQLLYTSGTTGEPKGVLHTSNTLLSSIVEFNRRLGLTDDDVVFMPSPLAHQTGFAYGMMTSLMLGAPLVTTDVWDPGTAVDLIERYGISYTFAATPFLSDLANHPGVEGRKLDSFRIFVTAGAPIPPPLVETARRALKINLVAGWGMTEVGISTSTLIGDGREVDSDGLAVPGSEVRVVDDGGRELPPGESGHLQYRGSVTFVGYYKRPHLSVLDDDGWFDTGDIARMDEDGYIRIIGRGKDIIIRGGENIPVVEVENLIHEMPGVSDVAIVAMPDERLVEKACAFVTLHDGAELSLAAMCDFLRDKELAVQYLPERLEILDEMPRTASGKIQKFVLRERAAGLS